MKDSTVRIVRWLVLLAALLPGRAFSQGSPSSQGDFFPSHGFLVTGYGSASYGAVFADGKTPNDFGASLNPIFLFQISDVVLFESELEFALEDNTTTTELEYATIGYVLSNDFVVSAGKFLLPFNVFSERLHPTWINKGIAPPAIYGHHGGGGPAMPLLPVLSDVGVQLRGSFDVGEFGYVTAVGFLSQGPAAEAEEPEAGDGMEPDVPGLAFGENFTDNNAGKMFGARAGFGVAPYFEFNVSGMTAAYDDAGDLRFTGLGAHFEGRYRSLELHSEWIQTRQDVASEVDPGAVHPLVRNGYFGQLAVRYGKWEPLVRWSQLFDGGLDGETVVEGGRQLALGLSYWLEPALVLKIGFLANSENGQAVDNNRLSLQWAFGF